MRDLRLLATAVTALLVLSVLTLTGCGGAECADGTIEQDGECVLAEGLAECDDEEVLKAGECVAYGDLCESGTTYDADADKCVATEDACGANAYFEDGLCIADDPIDCDGDTELDANTNSCVVTEAVCGDNTAFSADEDRCVPTEDVCNDGTYFGESGLCYPEAQCKSGDVILDGYCVSPAEALADDAEYTADGNTNPDLGGDPVDLSVKDVGEHTIFAGEIDAPSDVDDDGDLDQDADYFRFSADAGDWFEISLMANGLPDPVFVVMSEDAEDHHYERFSGEGTGNDKTRQIAVPEDGDYFIVVLPGVLLSEWLVGADDWGYVGTLEQIDASDPDDHDFEDENLTGTLGEPGDNFVHLQDLDAGAMFNITWESEPDHADPIIQAWESPTQLLDEVEGSSGSVTVPESGEMYFIVDWHNRLGDEGLDYEISAEEGLAIAANGGEHEETFSADDQDAVRVEWEHGDTTGGIDVVITDEDGNTLIEDDMFQSGDVKYFGLEDGTYTVTFINDTDNDYEDVEIFIDVVAPDEAETFTAETDDLIQIEQDDSFMDVGIINDDNDEFVTADRFGTAGSLEFTAPADATYSINVYDFDDDIDVSDIEWTVLFALELGTFAVADDEVGDVVEVHHDHAGELELIITEDASGDELVRDEIEDSENGIPVIGVEEGNYSVEFFGELGDDFNLVTEFVTPSEITDFSDNLTGTTNEGDFEAQDYFSVELTETTTYDITLEHDGGSGGGRAIVYGLGFDELERPTSQVTGPTQWGAGNPTETYEFEFESDTHYIIRVGNDSSVASDDYDYILSFDEVTD